VTNKRMQGHGSGVNGSLDLNGRNYVVDSLLLGGLAGDNVSLDVSDSGGIGVGVASAAARVFAAGDTGQLTASTLKVDQGGRFSMVAPMTSTSAEVDHGGRLNVQQGGDWTVQTLQVGIEDTGNFTISGTGKVQSGLALLGVQKGGLLGGGGVGNVFVSGSGTEWECQHVKVGERGTGNLTVAGGASVAATFVDVGTFGGSGSITVRGQDSLLSLRGNGFDTDGILTIGSSGQGTVNIEDFASVIAKSLIMGSVFSGDADGTLNVNSTGLFRAFTDGDRGGTAAVQQNGKVNVNDTGFFIADKSLRVDGELHINGTGQVEVGVGPGGATGQLSIKPGGTLSGTGTIFSRGVRLAGGANGFTGQLSPGNSPGTLTIEGNFEQEPLGLLDIELAGASAGEFDVLKVVGDASIEGDLLLEFIDGFAPHQGDRFNFLSVTGARTGQFQNVEVRNLAPGFQFELQNDASGLSLVAFNDGVFIPEPTTRVLLAASLLGLLSWLLLSPRFAH